MYRVVKAATGIKPPGTKENGSPTTPVADCDASAVL